MRHRKKFNHLGRKKGHRMSMLANMSSSLIIHKRINTTLAKAKALKRFIEPLITKSKSDTTHNRRIVFSRIKQKNAISELFRNIAVKVGDRPGGYTRIIRLGNRLGDNAEMAMIELVDFNELLLSEKAPKKKSRRRGGKSKSKAPQPEAVVESAEEIQEAVVVEESTEEDTTNQDVSAKAEISETEETPVSEIVAEDADVQPDSDSDKKTEESNEESEDDKKE